MKILIVSNGYPPASYGGVEVYSSDLAQELIKLGHEVQVFCRASDPQAPDGTVRTETVEDVTVTRVVNDYKRTAAFEGLYEDAEIEGIFSDLLSRFNPDVVHFNHLLTLSVGLPGVAAGQGTPSLLMLHDYWTICQRVTLVDRWQRICPGPRQGGDCSACVFGAEGAADGWISVAKKLLPFRLRGWLKGRLRPSASTIHFESSPDTFRRREAVFRAALEHSNRVLVPSQFIHDILPLNGMAGIVVEVLPLGVGAPASPRSAPVQKPVRFGYVGAVAPLKGLETLLKAFRQVELDSIRLNIWGREDLYPQYAREMRRLATGDPRITFHGPFQPEQRAGIYQQMDVFVMPSVWHETFSLVAREALRSGVPLITSRVGALQELVQEGRNGFSFVPGDVDALAAIIRRAGEQPGCLPVVGETETGQILSIPEHVDRLAAIYDELVAGTGKAQA